MRPMDAQEPEKAPPEEVARILRWVVYGLLLPAAVAPFLAAVPVLLLHRPVLDALGPDKAGVVWRTLLLGGGAAAPFSVLANSFLVPRRAAPRKDLVLRGLVAALLLALPPSACVFRLASLTLPAPP